MTTTSTSNARLPRIQFRPSFPPRVIISGALGGLSLAILLQQFAVVFPSLGLMLTFVVGGALLVVLITNVLKRSRVGQLNARLATAEATLDSRGQASQPARPTTPAAEAAPASAPITERIPDTGLAGFAEPTPESEEQRRLAPGESVEVVERRGDWASVRTADGWVGWVDARTFTDGSGG